MIREPIQGHGPEAGPSNGFRIRKFRNTFAKIMRNRHSCVDHSPPRRGVSRAALLASSITVRKSAERKQRTYRPTSLRGVGAPSAAKARTGWSERRDVSAELQLRLRPIGLALRATPGASGSLPFLLRRF